MWIMETKQRPQNFWTKYNRSVRKNILNKVARKSDITDGFCRAAHRKDNLDTRASIDVTQWYTLHLNDSECCQKTERPKIK